MFDTAIRKSSGWQAAHDDLIRAARGRAGLDFEEGQKLRIAERARVHERLGYGSFVEYIERLFGYSPRLTLEKLRVAEALEGMPHLAEALRAGSTSWSSLRELTRVATRETEHAWLEAARGRRVREVERAVSGHQRGDFPEDAKHSSAERHVLRFGVSAEVLATFREALAKLRRDAGEPFDDDAALLLMARQILAGPADDGRASYQVALTVCEACGAASQTGRGESVHVSPEIGEMARCDAQLLKLPRTSKAIVTPHVGGTKKIPRASQSVPPAIRRAVLERDQHRCQVPGCRHATFVDVHHLRARKDGGGHEPNNLLTLCGAHHRACHRGDLLIHTSAAGRLSFYHADGTVYGDQPSIDDADVTGRAFRGLRKLGFGEGEVRTALREASAHLGDRGPVENVLRSALELLTRDNWAKAC